MSSMENKDVVQTTYEKMVNGANPELSNDDFYKYFYNLLETGMNYCKFMNVKLIKSVDEEWVNQVEMALPSLYEVVMHPRKFIEEQREVVNIAMARNINSESVRHLIQHSDMIDKYEEDGTVVPNRILNIFKEESYNVYENRFVCTLLAELQQFVNTEFVRIMRGYPAVRHPIVKTNAIGKNKNYKACHKLWNFIYTYDKVGYRVELVKQEPVISRQFEKEIYDTFIWNYAMLHNQVDEASKVDVERDKLQKETDIKYIRQLLDEIIRNCDTPDANLRKIVQRLRKSMNIHLMERRALPAVLKERRDSEGYANKEAKKNQYQRCYFCCSYFGYVLLYFLPYKRECACDFRISYFARSQWQYGTGY